MSESKQYFCRIELLKRKAQALINSMNIFFTFSQICSNLFLEDRHDK